MWPPSVLPYANTARIKGLEFSLEMEKELPSIIVLDRVRLRQIPMNITENAIKFTSSGFVKLTAGYRQFENEKRFSELFFIIEDSGIGIAPDQKRLIFERFSQQKGEEILNLFPPPKCDTLMAIEKLKELLTLLSEEMLGRWEYLNDALIMGNIQVFAEEIVELGQTYGYAPLRVWGEAVSKQAKTFDMVSLPDTLKCFPNLIDQLSRLVDT